MMAKVAAVTVFLLAVTRGEGFSSRTTSSRSATTNRLAMSSMATLPPTTTGEEDDPMAAFNRAVTEHRRLAATRNNHSGPTAQPFRAVPASSRPTTTTTTTPLSSEQQVYADSLAFVESFGGPQPVFPAAATTATSSRSVAPSSPRAAENKARAKAFAATVASYQPNPTPYSVESQEKDDDGTLEFDMDGAVLRPWDTTRLNKYMGDTHQNRPVPDTSKYDYNDDSVLDFLGPLSLFVALPLALSHSLPPPDVFSAYTTASSSNAPWNGKVVMPQLQVHWPTATSTTAPTTTTTNSWEAPLRTELVDRGVILTEDQATWAQMVPVAAQKVTTGGVRALQEWTTTTALGWQGLRENPPRMDVEAVTRRLQGRAVVPRETGSTAEVAPVTELAATVEDVTVNVAPVTELAAIKEDVAVDAATVTEMASPTSSVLEEGPVATEASTKTLASVSEEAPVAPIVVEEQARSTESSMDTTVPATALEAGTREAPSATVSTTEEQWLAAAAAAAAAQGNTPILNLPATTPNEPTTARSVPAEATSPVLESTSTTVSQALPTRLAVSEVVTTPGPTNLDVASPREYASPAPMVFDKYFTNHDKTLREEDEGMAEAFDDIDMQEVVYYATDTSLF